MQLKSCGVPFNATVTAAKAAGDCCADRSLLQGDCFSADGRYRYALWRKFREDGAHYCVIMMNPSLADRSHSDPTVTRCERFVLRWGGRGLDVVNLFGLVSPKPEVLRTVDNPVDEGNGENDAHIRFAVSRSDFVLLAWGDLPRYPKFNERIAQVHALLESCNVHALTVTKSGQPGHPLYLLAKTEPRPYHWPAA
jgi:hypothetical protein